MRWWKGTLVCAAVAALAATADTGLAKGGSQGKRQPARAARPGGGGSGGGGGGGKRPLPKDIFDRIVMARVYQTGRWTLKQHTPDSVGRVLARYKPTYCASLVRVRFDEKFTQKEADAFLTIRRRVLAANPRCKFDVVLNAESYVGKPYEVTRKMKEIDDKIPVDLWYFDFWNTAHKKDPRVIRAAVTYAHTRGQWIGGNCWGNAVPPGSDFAVIDDEDFILRRDQVENIRRTTGLPVIVHLNNNPQLGPKTECAIFVSKYTTKQREDYVRLLADRQRTWGYEFMYPVFFPEYPVGTSYDAANDGDMLDTLHKLMRRHNRL